MSRSSREQPKRLNAAVLIFPIVMGLIGWFVMSKTVSMPTNTNSPITTPVSSDVASSTFILFGRVRPASDRDEKLVYHVEAQTLTASSTEKGWRVSKTAIASLSQRTEGGVWILGTSDWSVSLRDARGRAYQDPALLGAFDATHFVVIAITSDRRVILSVARTGTIREIANVSEATMPLSVQGGKLWLVELPLQEGIEMSPVGPSSVWSLAMDGTTSTRVLDERINTIVTNVVAQGSAVVFASDTPDMRWVQAGVLSEPVAGKPLGWISGPRLVFVQKNKLCIASSPQSSQCGPEIPPGLVLVDVIP